MDAKELDHSMRTSSMQQKIGSWQDLGDDAADEETLSLSDLVISSNANNYWNDDFSKEDPQSATFSSSCDHQDFFEFFSEDFSASDAAAAYSGINNNIIFCGKLIPNRDQQQPIEGKSQSLKRENKGEKSTSNCLFPWKNKSNSSNKSTTFPPSIVGESKKLGDEKFDFSVKKASTLAIPVKSKWYLFALGVGRFPMEMEFKDMKMRQSRKSKALRVQQDGDEPKNVKINKEHRRSAKRLWSLLKVLGWKNKHTNAAV